MNPAPVKAATTALALAVSLAVLAACESETPRTSRSAPVPTDSSAHNALSVDELARATATARQVQATVQGTFIGATAAAMKASTKDPVPGCPVGRLIRLRLVWKADAGFEHSWPPGRTVPDGPRKALLVTTSAASGAICSEGAAYRHVGAAPAETLLYGSRP